MNFINEDIQENGISNCYIFTYLFFSLFHKYFDRCHMIKRIFKYEQKNIEVEKKREQSTNIQAIRFYIHLIEINISV